MELKGKFLDIDLKTSPWKAFPKNIEEDAKMLIILASAGFKFLTNNYLYIRDYNHFPIILNYKKDGEYYITGAKRDLPGRDGIYKITLTYDFLIFYCSKKYLF